VKVTQATKILFIGFSFLVQSAWSQNGVAPAQTATAGEPVFTARETEHDFGIINENDGFASHPFIIQNTGTAPLVISHVQSSCGCTEPEWSPEPIEPGRNGFVIITYDPTHRPGPFLKNVTVYTNEKTRRQRLTIKGDVVPQPGDLQHILRDSIESVQLEYKDFEFSTIAPKTIKKKELWIRNTGPETVAISIENVPDYIQVEVPDTLASNKAGRLRFTLDATSLDIRGRRVEHLTWNAVNRPSGKKVTQTIPVIVNFVDDFTTMSAAEKSNPPAIQLSSTLLEYGTLKLGGFLKRSNKSVSQQVTITNTGKSPLIIHSVGTDDAVVQISGLAKTTLQPDESLTLDIAILPKSIEGEYTTELYITCNDPKGPVRQISITAQR
jgi:hypothetical protein